jgi:hypothetical protein
MTKFMREQRDELVQLVTSGCERGQGSPEARRFPTVVAKVGERHALRRLA